MNINDLLITVKREMESEFCENILPYWYKYSMDEVNGGFFGRISHNNIPIEEAEKGGILNARILWAFSAAFKIFPSSETKEIAYRAFHYFIDHLIDKNNGGVFWTVDYKGEVSDDRKHVYVQAFAIYGLIEYYSAFDDVIALNQAQELYHLIESQCKDDVFGGYFEAYSDDWKLIDDARLSDKDQNVPKSMNTHLHVLEAYTNLYRYAPSHELYERLVNLLEIFDTHIFNYNNDSLNSYLDRDWSSQSIQISYGHDIEASWLCLEAAEILGDQHWIDVFGKTALKVSKNVIKGTDLDGGIINELTPTTIIDSDKDWWPQAEAVVGHLNAYQVSNDVIHLKAAIKSWSFIKNHIIDHKNGEWFEKVNKDGQAYSDLDKVRLWKAPYHNSRAMFEVSRRVESLLNDRTKENLPINVINI